jgi:hypothetical protein
MSGTRQTRTRRDVAQIGAKSELEAAAEGDAVHRGDHGYGQLAPQPDDVLGIIGHAVRALGKIGEWRDAAASGHGGDSLDVETGAKGGALAGEHHGAQASIIFEPRAGFGDRSEHSRIEGVHLVGAIEPDIGDAVCDREPDAIFHGTISFLLLLKTRRAWLHGATPAELGRVERSKTKRGAHCRDK